MKYLAYLLVALLIPVGASALVDAQLQRYDPTPAQPGDLLTVQLAITNDADTQARGVELEILPSGTVSPEGRNTLRAGTVGAKSTYVGSLQVRVAAEAPPGEAVLRMRVREEGTDWQERTGIIQIQPSQAGILISNVDIQPETINPGRSATVTLDIQNNANSLLREVNAQLQLDETPFAPQQQATRQRAGDLAVGEQTTINYQLSAQPEAQAGIYRVPITLSFLDRNGNTVEQQDMIGLTITTEQQVTANVETVERTSQGAQITARVVNKGLSEVKFVETHAQEATGYTIFEQERNAYLGNIQSDDWQTMRFNIQTNEEQVEIPFSYTYKDTFNQEHQEEQTLAVTIPPSEDTGLGLTTALLVALVLAGGWWVYTRRKKKQ